MTSGEAQVAGKKKRQFVDCVVDDPGSSQALRGALAYTFDGILMMSPAGVIQQANHSACGILGRPLDKLIGRRVQDFVQVRRTSVPVDIFAAPQGHGGHQTAFTLKRRSNSAVDVLVRECRGELPGENVWILRELTPDGLVIEALERQSRLLLEAQQVGRTGAWELDIKTGRMIWTLELRRIMELPDTNEEMTIERSFNFYAAASEAIVREAFTATVTRGTPYDLELEVITARGNRIWVREVCRATIHRGRLISLIGVLQDITERRRLADFLAHTADQERGRVGADLHDGLGQELTGFALMLHALAARSRREAPALSGDLVHLSRLASSSIAAVRDMAHGMLPMALRHGDFKLVLQELAGATRRSSGVRVALRFGGDRAYFPVGRVAEHLYRIAQEAITNAIKHGRAKHLVISVHGSASKIRFSVSDDGVGFDFSRVSVGMGLEIMRHRVRMLGGLVDIRRARTGGTRVLCVVPPAGVSSATTTRQPARRGRQKKMRRSEFNEVWARPPD
jgi:signal transduction histidine kinase